MNVELLLSVGSLTSWRFGFRPSDVFIFMRPACATEEHGIADSTRSYSAHKRVSSLSIQFFETTIEPGSDVWWQHYA